MPTSVPRPAAPLAFPAPRPLRVLYADDVRELRDVIRLTLGRDGHAIECAAQGEEALALLSAAPDAYDLLITDHHMPVMNGLDLVARVRAPEFGFRGRIIVFTSELSLDVAAAYRRHGIDRMLPKPVFPSELRRIVSALFGPVPAKI